MELSTLKALLGIDEADNTKNTVLNVCMGDVTETIKNYCHVDVVPEGLLNTAYRMAVDVYKNEFNVGNNEVNGAISSINEGRFSMSFDTSQAVTFSGSILKNYQSQLNKYRSMI